MNRAYILFRTLQIIYEVTGETLSEGSWLDFDDHENVMSEIKSRLCEGFCIVSPLPECDTVSDLVDSICEGVGIYMTRDEVLDKVQRCLGRAEGLGDDEIEPYPLEMYLEGLDSMELVDFILDIEKEFDLKLSDKEADELVELSLGEIVDWLMEVKRND